MLQSVVN